MPQMHWNLQISNSTFQKKIPGTIPRPPFLVKGHGVFLRHLPPELPTILKPLALPVCTGR